MFNNAKDAARYLNDEKAAGGLIEKLRWPDGNVTCPLCDGTKDGKARPVYECSAPNAERKQWKCGACRRKFSVTSRSIFEGSHIRLGMWIYAIHKMCTSKKGISAKQLQRELGL